MSNKDPNDVHERLTELVHYAVRELLDKTLQEESQLPQFIEYYMTWKAQVNAELANLSKDAPFEWEALGAMPPIGIFRHAINGEHNYYLNILAERERRLRAMLIKYLRSADGRENSV